MPQMSMARQNAALRIILSHLVGREPEVAEEIHQRLLVPVKGETDVGRRTRKDGRDLLHEALVARQSRLDL